MPPDDPRTDQDLIDAINNGDAGAFSILYLRYRDRVAQLAFRFTRHHDDALDVMQETFTYFLRKFPGFVLTASLMTFFYPAVRNLSIAARRRRLCFQGADASDVETPAPPESADHGDLRAALCSLPETHREVVLMRFVDGLSLEEIGVALNIPTGTVKSRLHNALSQLRENPRTRAYFEPDG